MLYCVSAETQRQICKADNEGFAQNAVHCRHCKRFKRTAWQMVILQEYCIEIDEHTQVDVVMIIWKCRWKSIVPFDYF